MFNALIDTCVWLDIAEAIGVRPVVCEARVVRVSIAPLQQGLVFARVM